MPHRIMDNMLFNSTFHFKYIALLVILVLVLTFGALPNTSLLWQETQNSGHTLLFITITILILLLLKNSTDFFCKNLFKFYGSAFSISFLIGIAIELVQSLTHGDASAMDIVRDLAGIIIGMGLYAITDPELRAHRLKSEKIMSTGIIMLSFFVFTASMLPLISISTAYVQREIAFPVVVDLTANWMEPFLQLKNTAITFPESEEIVLNGEDQLTRVDFKNGTYPGVLIIETAPDWSAFKTLSVVIHSTLLQPFDLVLRVHDDQHNYDYTDRFNTKLTINNGTNYFRILLEDIKMAPANRKMNMIQIKEIIFFLTPPIKELHFYMGKIRLE